MTGQSSSREQEFFEPPAIQRLLKLTNTVIPNQGKVETMEGQDFINLGRPETIQAWGDHAQFMMGNRGNSETDIPNEPFCADCEPQWSKLIDQGLALPPADHLLSLKEVDKHVIEWLRHNAIIGTVTFRDGQKITAVPLIRKNHKITAAPEPELQPEDFLTRPKPPYGARTLLAFLPQLASDGIIIVTDLQRNVSLPPAGLHVSDLPLGGHIKDAAFARFFYAIGPDHTEAGQLPAALKLLNLLWLTVQLYQDKLVPARYQTLATQLQAQFDQVVAQAASLE